MLSNKDFAIIRAAMQFLDEEFSRSDDSLLNHYLDDRGILAGARVADIRATRSKLAQAKVYLGLKRVDEQALLSTELYLIEADLDYQADKAVPVSIIEARPF